MKRYQGWKSGQSRCSSAVSRCEGSWKWQLGYDKDGWVARDAFKMRSCNVIGVRGDLVWMESWMTERHGRFFWSDQSVDGNQRAAMDPLSCQEEHGGGKAGLKGCSWNSYGILKKCHEIIYLWIALAWHHTGRQPAPLILSVRQLGTKLAYGATGGLPDEITRQAQANSKLSMGQASKGSHDQ